MVITAVGHDALAPDSLMSCIARTFGARSMFGREGVDGADRIGFMFSYADAAHEVNDVAGHLLVEIHFHVAVAAEVVASESTASRAPRFFQSSCR